MKAVDYEAKITAQSETAEMPITTSQYETPKNQSESVAGTIGWLVWERRRPIGKKLGIFLGALTIILLLIPNSYESTTTLMPPDNGDNLPMALGSLLGGGGDSGGGSGGGGGSLGGGGGSGLGGLAGSLLGMKNQGDVFIGVLQCETVQNRLINKFDLRRVYWTKHYDSARDKLSSNTTITSDRKSGIITITVSDHRAVRAQQMAQTYVEELDHMMAQVSTSAARRERIFLEERLKQVKVDLDEASRQLGEFSSKNTTFNIDAQAKAMVETEGNLTGQLIGAQSELAGLKQIYSDNNVRVKSLKAQIDGLSAQIAQFGGTPGSSTERISGIMAPTLRALPLVGTTYTDYFRKAKIQETVFEVLTQEYEMSKVEEAKEIPPVKVLDPADLAERKSWPPRGRIIIIAAVLGMCFAVGRVWAEYRWDRMDDDHPRKVTLTELRNLAITICRSAVKLAREVPGRLRKGPPQEAQE